MALYLSDAEKHCVMIIFTNSIMAATVSDHLSHSAAKIHTTYHGVFIIVPENQCMLHICVQINALQIFSHCLKM